MTIEKTELSGFIILTHTRHGDARGFFSEIWSHQRTQEGDRDRYLLCAGKSLAIGQSFSLARPAFSDPATWAGQAGGTVHWDSCGINLGVDAGDVLLSDKGVKAPALADFNSPFVWEGTA